MGEVGAVRTYGRVKIYSRTCVVPTCFFSVWGKLVRGGKGSTGGVCAIVFLTPAMINWADQALRDHPELLHSRDPRSQNRCALHIAVAEDNEDMVKFLLRRGVSAKDPALAPYPLSSAAY